MTLGQNGEVDFPVYQANVVDGERPWQHDSGKLAKSLIDLYMERTGPLAM